MDRTLAEQPRLAPAVRIKVASCALLDRPEEAHRWARRLLELHPGFAIAPFVASIRVYNSPEVSAVYAEGLRKAWAAGRMSRTRRLAAILAADMAGYSRLMRADEEGTLERLKVLRREPVDPKIAEHNGRIPGLNQV